MSTNLIAIREPKSPRTEEYRMLRTNIEFSLVDKEKKVIMVTSSMPSEGKSTTTSNLGVTLKQLDKKVIIVDCDQRKPTIHKKFGLSNSIGLSDYIVKNLNIKDVIKNTIVYGLDVLTAGTIPPNPSELLSSQKMKNCIDELHEIYDYVILDTPPIELVADAQILSRYVDGALLVVASNEVDRNIIVKAKKTLEESKVNIIGVVLNKVELDAKDQYYYYGYEKAGRKRNKKLFSFSRKSFSRKSNKR